MPSLETLKWCVKSGWDMVPMAPFGAQLVILR